MESQSAPKPVRLIPNMRPLLFDAGGLYCSRFNAVYVTFDFGQSFSLVTTLQVSGWKAACARWSSRGQQVLRTGIYRMRILANGNQVFLFQGGVYTRIAGSDVATRTFSITRGSRPVSLAAQPNGLTVFGEYFSNPQRESVHIHGSSDNGLTWNIVHAFPAGSIRHVHGMSYDRWEDCFWICTGDYRDECCLLRASEDFQRVEVVRQGGQANRFYSILVQPDRLVLATDTPLTDNYIYTYTKETGHLNAVQQIENSNFYGCAVDRRIFVSTVAEPSTCNDDRACHVWMNEGAADSPWRRIFSWTIDSCERVSRLPGMPKGLFQYPRIFFPEGENLSDTLVCHGTGLRNRNNTMACFDASQWDAKHGDEHPACRPLAA